MRRMVSLSEFRSARTHTFHHGFNIPIRMTRNQASMIDLQDQPLQGAPVGLADPILTAVHNNCLSGDKGGIIAC